MRDKDHTRPAFAHWKKLAEELDASHAPLPDKPPSLPAKRAPKPASASPIRKPKKAKN